MLLIGIFALVLMLATPAHADPVSIAILGTISASLAASKVAIAITTILLTTMVSMALSYVASALLKPAGRSGGGAGMPDTSLNSKASVRQPTAPMQVVYGKTKVGGVFADMWVSDATNQLLCGALIIAGHEITGIDELWLGDENTILDANGYITGGRYAGNGTFLQYFGTNDQTACQMLIDNSNGRWTTDHRLRGLAYLAFQLYWDNTTGNGNPAAGNFVVEHRGAKLWQGSLPNMTAVIRGRKIYDPRTGQTAYSNNSALVVADYLCDPVFGLGVSYATGIDETALIAAANACDELVTLADGTTEKRFTTDGFFKVDGSPDAILGRLLGAMHGQAIYDGERWVIKAGIWEEPDAVVLTDDDMRAASSLQTLTSTRDISNGVKGTYVGAETKWQPADFPSIKSTTFTTDDGGVDKWRDIELPYSSTATRCQRLAKIDLLKQRYEIVETFKGKLSCWRYTAGQTVYRTSERYGWVNKAFMIGSVRVVPDQDAEGNPMVGVDLTLYETAASIYNWSTSEETPIRTPTTPTMPDLYNVTAPTGFTATESTYTTEGGQGIKSKVLLAWTASQDALVKLGGWYELEYKLSADTTWIGLPDTTSTAAEVLDVKPATYNYRLRAVNYAGNPSAWISTTLTVSGDTTAPEDVVGFTSLSGVSGYTTFSWTAPVNERARNGSAEIRYSTATSGATWAGSSAIVVQSALNTTATVQTKIGTYLIKYKSANGIYSVNASSTVISTTQQPKVGIEIVSALPTTDLYNGRLVFLTTDGKLYRYVTGVGWTTAVPTTDLSGYLAAANFPTNLRPVEIVSALPTTGNFEGRVVFLTTDNKLYRYTGSAWTAEVAASDLTGQVTNAQIADMAAAKLTGSITTTQISDNAISTPKLAAGSVVTSKLASGSITTEKLQIGDFNNYVSNSNMALGAVNWGTGNAASYLTYVDGLPTGVTMTAGTGYEGSGYHIAVASGAAAFIAQNANRFPVTPGDMYLLRATVQRVSTPSQTLFVGVRFVNAAGTEVPVVTGSQTLTWTSTSSTSYSTQTIASDSILVPAGAVWGFAVIYTTGTLSGGSYRVGEVTVLKKAGGSLIVDGSIVADKLATNSVTADKVVAGAISAAALAANAVTAEKLFVGDINNYVANATMAQGAQNWGTGNAASYLTYVDGLPASAVMTAGNGYAGSGYHILIGSGAPAFIAQNANRFAVTPGDMYLLRATVQRVSTPNRTLYVALRFVDAVGTEVTVTTGSQALTWTSASSSSYSTQTIASDSIVVPTGAVWGFAVIYMTATLSGGSYRVGEVSVLKKAAGALIVDGSIVAAKLAADSVTANAIKAGEVTAAKIGVTNLSAISADLGTVTAGTITGLTHQTATAGSVRAVFDTRIMFRCEDPNYASRTYYRNVGWSEPNIASHIGAESGYSYSRLLNYGGTTALDIQSFGDNNTPANTPSSTGLYSRGDYQGVYGSSSYIGVNGYGVTYDHYASGPGSNYGPFTGAHDALVLKTDSTTLGDIVVDAEVIAQKSISNAITRVELSSAANQRGVLGVVSSRSTLHHNAPPVALAATRTETATYDVLAEDYADLPNTHDRLTVNAVGEGLINVCGQGGDIAIGDLIVTSDTPGKGMKQGDDIIRGYTVAKARETATFATAGEVKTIACIYVSG